MDDDHARSTVEFDPWYGGDFEIIIISLLPVYYFSIDTAKPSGSSLARARMSIIFHYIHGDNIIVIPKI